MAASPAEREAAVALLGRLGGDIKKAAELTGYSRRFLLERWAARSNTGKGFKNKRGQGRKRVLGAKAKGVAKQMALGRRKRGSKEIASRELSKRGWTEECVSSRTVRRQQRQGSTRALRCETQKRAQRITA